MLDNQKNQSTADTVKASAVSSEVPVTSAGETKKKIHKAPKVKKTRKRGLPIAVDILIVVALLAIIAGTVWGVYAVGNYFSTKYVEKEIMYTLLAQNVRADLALDARGDCVVTPDSDVFVVADGQNLPVGRVLSVSVEHNEDGTINIFAVVRTRADYNNTLGYFVDETKIAVGKEYTCRFSNLVSDAVIVEMLIKDKES